MKKIRTAITISIWCGLGITMLQFFGCSSSVELTSAWRRTDMVIDGNQHEWEGDLYNFKKANVTIGIRNDEKNLYLCFISLDRNVQRQIMRNGFTVWFDPSGGTEETYGIQFPVGASAGALLTPGKQDMGASMHREEIPTGTQDTTGFASPQQQMHAGVPSIFDDAQSEIRFVGPKKSDAQLSTMIELKTVKIRAREGRQSFVYELQVPLSKTSDFPFTLKPVNKNNVLGIEFKTEENTSSDDMKAPGSDERGGRNGMGRQGRMGRYGGRPGENMGNDEDMRPEGRNSLNSSGVVDVWTKVTLAQE